MTRPDPYSGGAIIPGRRDLPDRSTLSRWLKRATQQGVICCAGSGYRGDGFRYWLPGRELFRGPVGLELARQGARLTHEAAAPVQFDVPFT